MSKLRPSLTALAAMALILSSCTSEEALDPAAAPSSAESSSTEPATASPSAARPSAETTDATGQKVRVKVIDTDFAPVKVTIAPGTTVRWKQVGDQAHSVSATDGSFDSSPDCGPLDSDKCLGQGDTFSATFDKPGKFDYYCRVHGLPDGTGMFGTIVVD